MPDELIATDLLRIARDPGTGRLVRRNTLAVGLRAALLAELALAGQIVDYAGAPYAISTAPNKHRFLDQIRDAVAARPGVSWPRWFRHVHGDRADHHPVRRVRRRRDHSRGVGPGRQPTTERDHLATDDEGLVRGA